MKAFKKKWLASAVAVLALGGCFSSGDNLGLSKGDVFVLTGTNQLATFNRTEPSVIRTSIAITGLAAGDTLLGMDFRPRDGQLYAIARTTGNAGRLYTLNTNNGAATAVASLIATAGGTFTTLDPAATAFSVDFNPVADALRVISDTGQNLRIFVANATGRTAGETTVDGPINGAATTGISGAGYTNSFDGTTFTRLLNINTTGDNLTFQDPPNGGLQVVAAPLGVNATGSAQFDIDAKNNRGFALMNVGGSLGFYTIAVPDSTTGLPVAGPAAALVGNINLTGITGMALAPVAAPEAVVLDGTTAGSQRLLKFGIRTPNTTTATNVTGLPTGERLLSIDFRPSNSTVYGLSSAGKIFTINTDTGAATLAVTLNVANAIVNGVADGKRYQIDFNPQVDALRIVSRNGSGAQGENYRIVGARLAGGAAMAGVVAGDDVALTAGFNIVNIAYTNNFANPAPAATRLFDIDGANNRLALQSPPNAGTLTAVGTNLGPAFVSHGGFDISGGDNGMRLLAGRTTAPGVFSLFNLDLTAGTAAAAAVASGTNEIGTGANASADLQDLTIKF